MSSAYRTHTSRQVPPPVESDPFAFDLIRDEGWLEPEPKHCPHCGAGRAPQAFEASIGEREFLTSTTVTRRSNWSWTESTTEGESL